MNLVAPTLCVEIALDYFLKLHRNGRHCALHNVSSLCKAYKTYKSEILVLPTAASTLSRKFFMLLPWLHRAPALTTF